MFGGIPLQNGKGYPGVFVKITIQDIVEYALNLFTIVTKLLIIFGLHLYVVSVMIFIFWAVYYLSFIFRLL